MKNKNRNRKKIVPSAPAHRINQQGFTTRSIHAGQKPDPYTGAIMTPIVLSSTYAQSAPGQHKGYEYSRVSNPTRKAFEDCLASLEEGNFCYATSSGVAAESLVFELLKPGDHLVAEKDLYGGTLRILTKILAPRNIYIHLLDLSKPENFLKIPKKTRMVWIESPSNPEMKLIDIALLSTLTKKLKILLAVDNTFMSPFFQKPLLLGADIVVHSATKYLSGHSDITAGAIITSKKSVAEEIAFLSKSLGPALSPFDSYLLLRSLKTLSIRMQKHAENAIELARFLEKHPSIKKVLYPGLKSHPQYLLAKKQMSGNGGMITIYIKGNKKDACTTLKQFQICTLAESLGGVESLVEHPATMTHLSSPHPPNDSMIRISCGLEDIEDLKQDFTQALAHLN